MAKSFKTLLGQVFHLFFLTHIDFKEQHLVLGDLKGFGHALKRFEINVSQDQAHGVLQGQSGELQADA